MSEGNPNQTTFIGSQESTLDEGWYRSGLGAVGPQARTTFLSRVSPSSERWLPSDRTGISKTSDRDHRQIGPYITATLVPQEYREFYSASSCQKKFQRKDCDSLRDLKNCDWIRPCHMTSPAA